MVWRRVQRGEERRGEERVRSLTTTNDDKADEAEGDGADLGALARRLGRVDNAAALGETGALDRLALVVPLDEVRAAYSWTASRIARPLREPLVLGLDILRTRLPSATKTPNVSQPLEKKMPRAKLLMLTMMRGSR